MTLEECISQLTRAIGYAPNRPPTKDSAPDVNNPIIKQGLQQYVTLMGVPYDRAHGDPVYKLASSWNSTQYVLKWAEGANKDARSGGGPRSRNRPVNWDDDEPATPKPDSQRPFAPERPATPAEIRLNEAAIIKAANTVIVPRLEAAKNDLLAAARAAEHHLSNQIADHIKVEVEAMDVENSIKSRLMESAAQIAIDATREYLDKITPRRIELVANGVVRELGAEPRHIIFEECLGWLLQGEHVYLVGNAGTGKTHLFKQLGHALDQKVTILPSALTKYEFSGHMGPTGEYVGTLLRTAVEEGHLLCFDEYDANAPGAIVFLNSLTSNRFIAFPDRMVEAHPNFKIVAAANTYGRGATRQFVGRNPMDAASLDRFAYVECPYDEALETQIFGESQWLNYVHKVRDAIERLKLPHIVSMRAIERGLRGIRAGFPADRICFSALWRGLDDDTIAKIKNEAGEFGLTKANPDGAPDLVDDPGLNWAFQKIIKNWNNSLGFPIHNRKEMLQELFDITYSDIEDWIDELPKRLGVEVSNLSIIQFVDEYEKFRTSERPRTKLDVFMAYCRENEKVSAIKVYKSVTLCGLLEAKIEVERIIERQDYPNYSDHVDWASTQIRELVGAGVPA